MTMLLDEKVVGLWSFPTGPGDILISCKELEDNDYEIVVRSRIHIDDKVWDSEDRKTFWKLKKAFPSRDTALEVLRAKVNEMHTKMGDSNHDIVEIIMEDDGLDGFVERLQQTECFYSKTEKIQ